MTIIAPAEKIRRIVVAGGGSAGWICATALNLGVPSDVEIVLVESEDIAIIGVGEATIPSMRQFMEMCAIDEKAFIKRTEATFKLGIEFLDWGWKGNRYFHGFGDFGANHLGLQPHQIWKKLQMSGDTTPLEAYSLPTQMAWAGRFFPPNPDARSSLRDFTYAYHFDATLYARYLREICEARGVKRINAKITQVRLQSETGYIEGLELDDGRFLEADFFVDCTGFRGLLIEGALKAGYTDWSDMLPVDRAWAVPCETPDRSSITPYTTSSAREAGWQWRIPLQHRVGNGHVYSSQFIDDQAAADALMTNLPGKALKDPMLIRFTTGRRNQFWSKNCICAGLASGFLEPLESTSINLVQSAIVMFLELYPFKGPNPILEAEYNRRMGLSYQRVRDFIILHYYAQIRDDSELWRYTRQMPISDELRTKIDLYRSRGITLMHDADHFHHPSWVSVMHGQGVVPPTSDPMADRVPLTQLQSVMQERRDAITRTVSRLPTHAEFIASHCPSPRFAEAL